MDPSDHRGDRLVVAAVDFQEGIGWYLHRLRPDLKRVTIGTVTQSQLNKLDAAFIGQADIILCVDEDVPGSY